MRSKLREKEAFSEVVDEDGLIRQDAPGRSRPRAKRTFDADWREPKLVTIFVHDEQGRMVKKSLATIDGTFQGPDALAEIVAMHLHRLVAAKALSVTFASDGALWIWDRIGWIVDAAGIGSEVKVYQVLDCCHAAPMAVALKEYGLNEHQRMPLYRQYRTQLRNGQWREVAQGFKNCWTKATVTAATCSAK